MERWDKLQMPKLDFLWKHVGWRKATITSMNVVVGDLYFMKINQRVINEELYVQRGQGYYLATNS